MSPPYLLRMSQTLDRRKTVVHAIEEHSRAVGATYRTVAVAGALSTTITQDDYVHELVHRKVAQLFNIQIIHTGFGTPKTLWGASGGLYVHPDSVELSGIADPKISAPTRLSPTRQCERQRADDSDNPLDKILHLRNMGPE
ncbi:uncharacterized protein BJ212DRAFT_1300947 [Suillus subaureus]|uniref:Uncharacterized protein n=1 Tax=Suillus subaureus TaxID=48587 RepID=A0A9P7E856_9AGAM|nr:uncharacterized protein BJ212DRAFT_1300947 [Suillus subaureus]KAG1813541.1 hypothetical protein BJ212DRAFT_1300947 [Suillus subaureus]